MRNLIRARSKFPLCIRHFEQLAGICVGGCIDIRCELAQPNTAKVIAHAHYLRSDPFRGWLCFRFEYCLQERLLLLHEMAHILTHNAPSHGKAWRSKVVEIGGTYNQYRSRHRHSGMYMPGLQSFAHTDPIRK